MSFGWAAKGINSRTVVQTQRESGDWLLGVRGREVVGSWVGGRKSRRRDPLSGLTTSGALNPGPVVLHRKQPDGPGERDRLLGQGANLRPEGAGQIRPVGEVDRWAPNTPGTLPSGEGGRGTGGR